MVDFLDEFGVDFFGMSLVDFLEMSLLALCLWLYSLGVDVLR